MARTYSLTTMRPALPVGVTGAQGGVDAGPAAIAANLTPTDVLGRCPDERRRMLSSVEPD